MKPIRRDASRRALRAPVRLGVALAVGIATTALSACGGDEPTREPPPPLPPASPAVERPSPADRVGYWLDRIVRGPEPTPYLLPDFHQGLLLDGIHNLEATPDATLARLADPALLARLTAQKDANPWYAILSVLAVIGRENPAVARAWAVPALSSDILTVRREAVPVLTALESPEDGPALLEALDRDPDDRMIAPTCARALLALGPPWDGVAARRLLESGVADRPNGESESWIDLPAALAALKGGARPDLLAWWALLAEPAGPRAKEPARRAWSPSAPAAPAPATASPDHAATSGKTAAARARAALAKAGFPAYVLAVAADLHGSDPVLTAIANEAVAVSRAPAEMSAVRARAAAWLDGIARGGLPKADAPETADGFIKALSADDDPEASVLLERFVRELPPGAAFTPAIEAAYDALHRRGSDPTSIVRDWLASGSRDLEDRALAVARHSQDPALVPALEAWLDRPASAPRRAEIRRLALFLVTFSRRHGGMDVESLPRWARLVATWAADRSDRSAAGMLGSLLDLGAPGEAQIAAGLAGKDRETYLSVISRPVGRYLSRPVVEALLAPVGADTPPSERRAALAAAFSVSGGDGAPALAALARRLKPADRPEAEMVLRIVRHRVDA